MRQRIERTQRQHGSPGRGQELRVLLYHRIEDPAARRPDLAPDPVSASPALFERQLRYLTRWYCPVAADELMAALAGRHRLPARAVLVTFDDGYRDFAELAWPLLKQYRVPAILFVPTAYVDDAARIFWWDALWQLVSRTARQDLRLPDGATLSLARAEERVAASRSVAEWLKSFQPAARRALLDALGEQLGVRPEPTRAVLDWGALRRLAADGVTIAPHSRTHELLDQVHGPELRTEIEGSRADLVRGLGACPPLFAYPNGNYSREAVQILRLGAFQAAFTTTHGINRLDTADHLLLRRDDGRASLARFALQLLGPLGRLRARRHPLPAGMASGVGASP